jgi:transcriptional regulator with XRE-family HTH domain
MGYKILERIKSVVTEQKITQREMSKGMKISVTTVNKLLNNEDELSLFMIARISEFLGVNDKWVLTGRGSKYLKQGEEEAEEEALDSQADLQAVMEKLKSAQEENERLKNQKGANSLTVSSGDILGARFVDSRNAKSYPQNFNDDTFLSKMPIYPLMGSRFSNKTYRVFEIAGEEMNHKIVDGDWVICEKVEDYKQIKDMYVYIIIVEQEVLCRRVLNRIKERGRLRLKCDNKFSRDREVNIEEVKEVWEVKSLQTFNLSNPYFQLEDWVKKIEDRLFEMEEKVDRK